MSEQPEVCADHDATKRAKMEGRPREGTQMASLPLFIV